MSILNQILLNVSDNLSQGVVGTLVYTFIGIVVAVIAYFIVDLIIPGKMGEQIAEDKNLAIAVVAGSMILGICIIIAASMVG